MFGFHASFLPLERNRPFVVGGDEPVDGRPKLVDGLEAAACQRAPLQDAEEHLHLVQPGSIGRRVVEMDVRVRLQPPVVLFGMGAEVVEDDMELDSPVRRHHVVHEVQELAPSLPGLVARQDLPGRHVQRREQRAAPVALVAVAEAEEGLPVRETKPALLPFDDLDAWLLVHADDNRVPGRGEVESDDVGRLRRKLGIRADAPGTAPLQVDAVPAHHAPHLVGLDAEMPGDQVPVPAGVAFGGLLVKHGEDAPLEVGSVLDGLAAPPCVAQSGRSQGRKPSAPLDNRGARDTMIGVGMARVRHPSLRTGRADLPHPALQSSVSLPRLAFHPGIGV
jgi:hypothetical protein